MNRLFRSSLVVFVVLGLIGLGWAIYTQHVWEDYYITYRASRNLATGQGLVFSPGERVHTFTSPLGVLLPAAASLLTLNSSDTAALWIFRVFSIAAFAGAGVLLWRLAFTLRTPAAAGVLLVALFASDNKIVDNSINGMETGILLLFAAWSLWALFARPPRQALHLGLSWAGLMWSRPDSFLYIAVLALGALAFYPEGRRRLLGTLAAAGGVTTLLYLPWFVGAWLYYGSPVPHTVVAKGLFSEPSAAQFLRELLAFPATILAGRSSLGATFMPAYGLSSGWPSGVITTSLLVSLPLLLLWLLPRIRWEARVASLAFLAGHVYLTVIVGFPVPWYIPLVTLFGLMALGLVAGQLLELARGRPRIFRPVLAAAALLLAANAALAAAAAYQLRVQQRVIETGHRRVLGEWLRDQARSERETVFLEPLGYIGYFSGLKMLDYPGLASPEVVAARRRARSRSYPACWHELIRDLRPDWLVLRPVEADMVRHQDPILLQSHYREVQRFDVRDEVESVRFLPGRGYLHHDAAFEVHRRLDADEAPRWESTPRIVPLMPDGLTRKEALGEVTFEYDAFSAHAPSVLAHPVPAGARYLAGRFGLFDAAYAHPAQATDGAEFQIAWLGPDGSRRLLFQRLLTPLTNEQDRGFLPFAVELPPEAGGTVELIITPGPQDNANTDWTYWTGVRFELPPEAGAARGRRSQDEGHRWQNRSVSEDLRPST